MKRDRRRSKKATLRDIVRLPSYFMPTAGTFMFRQSRRFGLYTAALSILGYQTGEVSGLKALLAPFVIGGTLAAAGISLKVLHALSSGKIKIAEANNLNLMEHYKKSEEKLEGHTDSLIDRVLKYESGLRYDPFERAAEDLSFRFHRKIVKDAIDELPSDTKRKFLHIENKGDLDSRVDAIINDSPHSDQIEMTRDAWRRSIIYAVGHYRSQNKQVEEIGFQLGLFEDWRDGAYFDQNDTKLKEQFDSKNVMRAIKKAARLSLGDKFSIKKARTLQKFWFTILTRGVAVNSVKATEYLNKKYDAYKFDAQTILWPGAEDEKWVEELGAREDLLRQRRKVIKSVFGRNYSDAETMVDHMFFCNVVNVIRLRKKYDPEYCMQGCLEYNVMDDVREERCFEIYVEQQKGFMKKVEKEMSFLDRYLQMKYSHIAEPKTNGDAEALRAVRIAYHTNRDGLKKLVQRVLTSGMVSPKHIQKTNDIIDYAIEHKRKYSEKLVILRMHHELTRLHVKGYQDMIRELAYTENKN